MNGDVEHNLTFISSKIESNTYASGLSWIRCIFFVRVAIATPIPETTLQSRPPPRHFNRISSLVLSNIAGCKWGHFCVDSRFTSTNSTRIDRYRVTNFDELRNDLFESRNVCRASISLNCREDNANRRLWRKRCTENNRPCGVFPRLEVRSTCWMIRWELVVWT